MATASREIACIHKFKKFPQQKGIFAPTAEAKISTLENYLKIAKYLLPKTHFLIH